jgi:hypothetical protein
MPVGLGHAKDLTTTAQTPVAAFRFIFAIGAGRAERCTRPFRLSPDANFANPRLPAV